MTLHIGGVGVELVHLVCEECGGLSGGYPRDETNDFQQHRSLVFAKQDGWTEYWNHGDPFYICPGCEAIRKIQTKGITMGFGDTFKAKVSSKLTEKQVADRRERLVVVDSKIDEILAEKRESNVSYNQNLKEWRKERRELIEACQTKTEAKEVDAFQRVNERRREVETVRVDNGEVIQSLTRPLTADEAQMSLDAVVSNKKPMPPKPKAKGDNVVPIGKKAKKKNEEAAE